MSKVLLIYEFVEPTNQGMHGFLVKAADSGVLSFRTKSILEIEADDINWCDVIISVRSTSDYERRLSKLAHALGKFWILLLDDDFLSLESPYGKDIEGYKKEKKCLKEILKYTDCLKLAVNELLAQKYTKIGNIPRYVLADTAVDCEHFVLPSDNNEKTKIVFYVNDGSKGMFDLYLRPLFPTLAKKYGDRISIWFLAIHPDMSEYDNQLEMHYIPHMTFDDFLTFMAEQHFDIGLAPLNEEGFSKYKYFNKYIEYTRAGIAGVYSDCNLYRQVVSNGYNGLLCENTVEGWMNALQFLIENPGKRVEIAKNAQEYAKEHFAEDKVIENFLENIPEVVSFKAPPKSISDIKITVLRIHYWEFRIRGWIYNASSLFKNGEFDTFAKLFLSKIKHKT